MALGIIMLVMAEKARAGAEGIEEVYFYHTNHLGTPIKLTDESGNVVWDIHCSPYTEVCLTNGSINQPLRFPGQYYDEETELHYNWHRYYNPGWGRYMERDKWNFESVNTRIPYYPFNKDIFFQFMQMQAQRVLMTNPELHNMYVYSTNNPLNVIEPSGMAFDVPNRESAPFIAPGWCMLYAQEVFNKLLNVEPDYIRHCRASCEIARKYGLNLSYLLGWMWEQLGRVVGGYEVKDLKANEKGRKCATGSWLRKSCEECCKSQCF